MRWLRKYNADMNTTRQHTDTEKQRKVHIKPVPVFEFQSSGESSYPKRKENELNKINSLQSTLGCRGTVWGRLWCSAITCEHCVVTCVIRESRWRQRLPTGVSLLVYGVYACTHPYVAYTHAGIHTYVHACPHADLHKEVLASAIAARSNTIACGAEPVSELVLLLIE